jgi:mannose-1-phosphate guanylyltransferase
LLQRITREYVDVSTYDEMLDRYSELPKNSFDYEVVERAQSVCVIPHEGTWKDLGTWDALCEELSEHISGPATVDDADAKDVHVINELDVPVVVAGISNAVVVVSSEGVLVASKSASSDIKGLVETASKTRPGATSEHGGRVQ